MNMTLNCGEKPLLLSSRTVTSLGIIINEVITNISKYAVPDEGTPDLTIEMTKKEDSASIIFRDNGPGYPEKQEGPGLGFKLIQSLLKGLNGSLEIKNRKEGGGELKITIPVV